MSRGRISVTLLCLGLATAALLGCGDDDAVTMTTSDRQSTSDTSTTETTETSSSATSETATSERASTATSVPSVPTSTSGDAATSSTTGGGATVESVVASVQASLDEEFAANPDPPPQLLGAIEISCDRSGAIAAGDLLACIGTPQTEPGFLLESVGVLFAILDDAGTAAWATGTDLPADDAALDMLVESATPGLFCRDLVDPDAQTESGFFNATTTNESFGYFLSVAYWFIEGRPDRMDEDGNGIPCETVHDAGVVAEVWGGGGVG